MRPHDIEKIAQAVSAGLTQKTSPLAPAGCGSVSTTQEFSCPIYECSENYECGGMGEFACGQTFSCPEGFFCSCVYSMK